MTDYSTKPAISKIANDVRLRHSALSWDASVDHLIGCEGIQQATFSSEESLAPLGFREKVAGFAKKIKAMVCVSKQLILISDTLPPPKTAFAKGHELGHSAIPWHKNILYACDEHDLTANARDQLEWEANVFSSEILLPGPLVDAVYSKYDDSIETILLLNSWSGASIESCAIKYAERHPRECAVLLLDEDRENHKLILRRKMPSPKGVKSVGMLTLNQEFPSSHTLYQSSRGKSGVTTTEISIDRERFRVSLINTSHRVIALVAR